MKKLFLGIVVLGLLWCNVVNAKEVFYLRCIPEVKVVRAGDFKEGDILQHRLMYLVFKNEIDLTISEKPRRILKKHKLYLVSNDGKKDKFSYSNVKYSTSTETVSIDFEDTYQSKAMQYFVILNVNHDGGSWVASSTVNITQVVDGKVEKSNFSWFAKCIEVNKKQFKKPEPNKTFYNKHK